jgi:putative ABC transport system permease protein
MKIPLSWLQLTHEKIRLLVALAGITFADMLMFMQLGFQDSLFDSSVKIHQSFKGDIFLMSPQSEALFSTTSFSSRRLYESLAVDGVASASPVYVDLALWKNPVAGNTRSILAIGFNPSNNVFNNAEIQQNLDVMKLQDFVLFDRQSRAEFGPIAQEFEAGKKVTTEISSRRVTVGGLFSMGASFSADGNLITSDLNFIRLFKRDKGLIDVGVISLKPQANIAIVKQALEAKLPEDIRVYTKEEFLEKERLYWETSTAIGFIFGLGTAMGFIVGIVIVYQILYTDVADHLPEYATLKAIGYTDNYFIILVIQEAVILAFLGYLPSIFVASFLYSLASGATNLPIAMTVSKATTVFLLTLIMCCVSGAIAIRKLRAADPADIF